MRCIIIAGPARSGKDAVADFLVEEHDFTKLVFSDILREKLERHGRPADKMAMAALGDELRQEHGQGVLGRLISEKAARLEKEEGMEKAVFVGPRSLEEVEEVRKVCAPCLLVKVEAAPQIRFERRDTTDPKGDEGPEGDQKAFFARDKLDAEHKGLQKVLDACQKVISNDGSMDDLRQAVDAFMSESEGADD